MLSIMVFASPSVVSITMFVWLITVVVATVVFEAIRFADLGAIRVVGTISGSVSVVISGSVSAAVSA